MKFKQCKGKNEENVDASSKKQNKTGKNFWSSLFKKKEKKKEPETPVSRSFEEQSHKESLDSFIYGNVNNSLITDYEISDIENSHSEWEKESGKEWGIMGESNNVCIYLSLQHNPDRTLTDSLRATQDLMWQLEENDNYIIRTISKFIQDQNLKKELINLITERNDLRFRTETNANSLINEIWSQQFEAEKNRCKILQDNLNLVIKQNRQLQLDNELLFNKYKKSLKKDSHELTINKSISEIFKQNKFIQEKLQESFRIIGILENENDILRQENEGLQIKLNSSLTHSEHLRVALNQIKTDFDLEIIKLDKEIVQKNKVVQEAVDIGNAFLEDLFNIKDKFKCLEHIQVDYVSCPIDLIKLCRRCVDKLSNEILGLQNQISLKDQDLQNVNDVNKRLEEDLKKSFEELSNISKTVEEEKTFAVENEKKKSQLLEVDLNAANEKMQTMQMEFETEKSRLLEKLSKQESLNEKIQNADKILDQTRMCLNDMTSESISVKNQMQSFLEVSVGDVLHELHHTKNQLQYYQEQYDVLKSKETSFKSLEEMSKELEEMKKENSQLKQTLDIEKQTLLVMKNEKLSFNQEKKMLYILLKQIKNDLSKVNQLEHAVQDLSTRASKYALIAEYNKEIGSKLKFELAEKNKTILILKTSMEKLNDWQTKENNQKISLTKELKAVQQLKEQLSEQIQKNSALVIKTQIKKYEEDKRNDRIIFNELVSDLKIIVNQKEALMKEVKEHREKICEINKEKEEQQMKVHEILLIKNKTDLKLKIATTKNEENDRLIKNLRDQIDKDVKKHQDDLKSLKMLISQIQKEKEDGESSLKYIQNNIQKLQRDLNEARRREKEAEIQREASQKTLDSIKEDNEELSKEIVNFNKLFENVLESLESSLQSSSQKEKLLKNELEESKKMSLELKEKNKSMVDELTSKDEEILKLQEACEDLISSLNMMKSEAVKQENECILLKNQLKTTVENNAKLLKQKDDVIMKLESEKNDAEKCVKMSDEEKYNENYLKNHQNSCSLNEAVESLQSELTERELQNSELTLKLHEMQKKFETERNLCDRIKNAQKIILMNVLKLKEEGVMEPELSNDLIRMVQNTCNVDLEQ